MATEPDVPAGKMKLWKIFEKPPSMPDVFVAELFFFSLEHGLEKTSFQFTCPKIRPLRAELERRGLRQVERNATDSPYLVEQWI